MVLTPRRWRQVCSEDAASDGDKKARSPGRSRRKPLKPLRAGMPGDFRCDRCEYSCAFLTTISHTRLRVHWAPGIPARPLFEGRKVSSTPRAHCAARSRSCIYSSEPQYFGDGGGPPLPLWERVGVRGYGLSIERNPSPGSHLSMRSDLSHKGRGDTKPGFKTGAHNVHPHNSLALENENELTRRVFSSRISVRVIGGSARWLQFSRSQSRQLTPIGVPSVFSRSIPAA